MAFPAAIPFARAKWQLPCCCAVARPCSPPTLPPPRQGEPALATSASDPPLPRPPTNPPTGLKAVYDKYGPHGLEILAFPTNNFGNQEPGSNRDIKAFAQKHYNVTFPMFEKVRGKSPPGTDRLGGRGAPKATNPLRPADASGTRGGRPTCGSRCKAGARLLSRPTQPLQPGHRLAGPPLHLVAHKSPPAPPLPSLPPPPPDRRQRPQHPPRLLLPEARAARQRERRRWPRARPRPPLELHEGGGGLGGGASLGGSWGCAGAFRRRGDYMVPLRTSPMSLYSTLRSLTFQPPRQPHCGGADPKPPTRRGSRPAP